MEYQLRRWKQQHGLHNTNVNLHGGQPMYTYTRLRSITSATSQPMPVNQLAEGRGFPSIFSIPSKLNARIRAASTTKSYGVHARTTRFCKSGIYRSVGGRWKTGKRGERFRSRSEGSSEVGWDICGVKRSISPILLTPYFPFLFAYSCNDYNAISPGLMPTVEVLVPVEACEIAKGNVEKGHPLCGKRLIYNWYLVLVDYTVPA
ncbi:hypothetical protein Trydic_g5827 [Trypoxylus dichotomus]